MRAFCPCHVTGFFALRGKEQTLLSEGCGVVLSAGATTAAILGDNQIFINGVRSSAPTSATVVQTLTNEPMSVSTSLSLPTSCGFGTSGAGALSTALAVSGTLKLGYSLNTLRDITQRAEIKHQTGVGDVVAQALGGVVIRSQQRTDRIPVPPLAVSLLIFGPIPTAQIIGDKKAVRAINAHGIQALKSLNKKPTFNHFMNLSREFATNSGLMSEQALDAIEAVEATGGLASMAMIGDAIFAIDPAGALDEFKHVVKTTLYHCGAHVITDVSDDAQSRTRHYNGKTVL